MSGLRGATDIGAYLVSARSFDEYRAMFALTDADLRGRVLDCPGGGASCTATARARGTEAIAVDPVYATPPRELIARLDAELTRGSAWATANAERYVWDRYGDPAAHARLRADSAATFARDLLDARGGYVAAALPDLPFPDAAFDLVLSSHLLFTYADRLDATFHVAACSNWREWAPRSASTHWSTRPGARCRTCCPRCSARWTRRACTPPSRRSTTSSSAARAPCCGSGRHPAGGPGTGGPTRTSVRNADATTPGGRMRA